MGERIPGLPMLQNPELNDLVAQLNGPPRAKPQAAPERKRSEDGTPRGESRFGDAGRLHAQNLPAPTASSADSTALGELLRELGRRNASDLHLVANTAPIIRVSGRLQSLPGAARSGESISELLQPFLTMERRQTLEQRGAVDFSLRLTKEHGGATAGRFRVNVHRQRGQLAAAVRALPSQIPTLEELNLPATLAELATVRQGLVLMSGTTGSGKTSTLAAVVGEINRSRGEHVITIEDPVEYEHGHERSVIEHIEVGLDTPTFAEAVRAAMRQDPDVLLIGELRDLETIAAALTAAETGHLVLATVHTHDAVHAIQRLVDVFPTAARAQIRHQLALNLHAVVAQQLIPTATDGSRVPAVEVLRATWAIRHHIRQNALDKIYNELVLGKRHGMITFEASLAGLVQAGKIDRDEAMARAGHPDELNSLLS